MKKILSALLLAFLVASPVMAQEESTGQDTIPPEAYLDDPEPQDPSSLELGEGVEEVIMLNSDADIAAYAESLASDTVEPEETESVTQSDGVVNCFDYYEFNSVDIQIDNPVDTVLPGEPQTFLVDLTNKNPYPLVDGRLFVKIFRERVDGSATEVNGDHIIDSFIALEDITLLPSDAGSSEDSGELIAEATQVTFEWTPPYHLPGGTYYAAGYYITSERFNLAGLSFTDDIIGGKGEFTVVSEEAPFYFDKEGVTLNGEQHQFIAAAPRIDTPGPISVVVPVKNETNADMVGIVTWDVYYWDAQRGEHLIESVDNAVTVPAGGSATIDYELREGTHAVYLIVPTLKYADEVISQLNVRFVRAGIDEPRINFPSLTTFPLKAGEETTLFSCLHNGGTNTTVPHTALTLTLLDMEGNELHSYTYRGETTGVMMAVADSFVPEADYKAVSLKATLTKRGEVIDEVIIDYACDDIDSADCGFMGEEGETVDSVSISLMMVWLIGGGTLLLLLVVLGLWMYGKKRKIHITSNPEV